MQLFSVEKTKLYVYKCFYRWRETNILKVYYIAFARNLILSFSLRPIEDMSNDKKETASITTFKKWSFANKFRIETEDGKVLCALCKYCSEVEHNDFIREAMSRNIKGFALKSSYFFRESVTYIHQSIFASHVGPSTSFHQWCKEKISGISTGDELTSMELFYP